MSYGVRFTERVITGSSQQLHDCYRYSVQPRDCDPLEPTTTHLPLALLPSRTMTPESLSCLILLVTVLVDSPVIDASSATVASPFFLIASSTDDGSDPGCLRPPAMRIVSVTVDGSVDSTISGSPSPRPRQVLLIR